MMTESTTDSSARVTAPEPPPPPGWDSKGNPVEGRRDDPDEKFMMDEAEMRIRGVIALSGKTGTPLTSYEEVVRAIVEQTQTTWESPILLYAVYFLWPEETLTMRDAAVRLHAIRHG